MAKWKQFQDRPPMQKAVLLAVGLFSLAVVGLTERDIQERPDRLIRGPKIAWRLVSLNALGALAYLGFGRRR